MHFRIGRFVADRWSMILLLVGIGVVGVPGIGAVGVPGIGVVGANLAWARPGNPADRLRFEDDSRNDQSEAPAVMGLSSGFYQDTVSYGGAWWAPDSMRWEALRDSCWTFDTGVGSSINTGGNPNKPVGYHQTMEGWYGIDYTLWTENFFRRSSTCVINGSWSMWAGLTLAEANARCWVGGQGYGNGWNHDISKSFFYPGAGNVTLSYQYAVDAEPGFDYTYVDIDTTGSGAQMDLNLVSYTGLVAGTASHLLVPGETLRSTPGLVTIRFRAEPDGSYSDEDGFFVSTCGLVAIDDVQLTGAIVDLATFESSENGWQAEVPTTGLGDFSDLADIGNLSPTLTFCPCSVRDSVLIFADEGGQHPFFQDNIAASPMIDLRRGGDVGRPGRLMTYDIYAELPLGLGTFVQIRTRYYPRPCPSSGLLAWSDWVDQGAIFYFGEQPFCTTRGQAPRTRDYSGVIPASAEQVQVAWGVLQFCGHFGCTGISNSTPWIDNISLGIYGSAQAPMISTTALSRFQDNFASDGSISLSAPGRFDVNAVKGSTTPGPGSVLGDTLTASGNGGNTEVRLVFKVRSGPFTNPASLAARAARWTAEPLLTARYGGEWYSARMDTAQQGVATPGAGNWMSTFHEDDPGFLGTDTSIDPTDFGPTGGTYRLANDIIPDNLFTAGSRLDYFVTSRYRPPDPRNPGGTIWLVDPDTTGGHFREAEILPSSADSSMTWNCTLYVDHHDDRDFDDQRLEEQGLSAALGSGVANAEGTRYDRWDVQSPTSAQLSFGRPIGSAYGASAAQALMYPTIVWHSGSLSSNAFSTLDGQTLLPWAQGGTIPPRFWGSGEGLVQSMTLVGGSAQSFLNGVLGVTQNCTTIRNANCPSGSVIDTTYCLPTVAVAGSAFASSILPQVRGNGCPDLRAYDVLNRLVSSGGTLGQLAYVKSGVPVNFASVTNVGSTPDMKTVLDGMSVGRLRSNTGYFGDGCNDGAASLARTSDVLAWFNAMVTCPPAISGVPDFVPPGTPAPPESSESSSPLVWTAALLPARPNPWTPATRLGFVNGAAGGSVRIDLVDVTGRLVRTLVNGPQPVGPGVASWDGRRADGRLAPPGLYFYQMITADGFRTVERLVVVR